MKKYLLMAILAFGIFAETNEKDISLLGTETIEESVFDGDFFTDESEKNATAEELNADFNEKSISLTGDFKTSGSFSDYDKKDSTVSGEISSNLNLDVRLKEGVKAYTSLHLEKSNNDSTFIDEKILDEFKANPLYDPSWASRGTNGDFIKLNEMFFDFNVKDKVYVRSGKQNLAWGRGYFFNPTDLINIEKKNLEDVMGQREGNFGVKVHVPSGISKNFYAYLQMEDKTLAKDLSLALKYEFLVKNTEFSVATILRNPDKFDPVIAADFAGSWGKAQTFGEVLVQKGDKISHYENGKDVKLTDKIVVQGTVGYSRTFDRGPKEDKKTLTLIQEAYYNGAGYSKSEKNGFPPKIGVITPFYNPYSDGIYFLANFITLNKFVHKDLSLGINALSNLSDNVHQVGGNLTYKLNDEINLGTSVTSFLGEQGALTGNIPKYTLGLNANIKF